MRGVCGPSASSALRMASSCGCASSRKQTITSDALPTRCVGSSMLRPVSSVALSVGKGVATAGASSVRGASKCFEVPSSSCRLSKR